MSRRCRNLLAGLLIFWMLTGCALPALAADTSPVTAVWEKKSDKIVVSVPEETAKRYTIIQVVLSGKEQQYIQQFPTGAVLSEPSPTPDQTPDPGPAPSEPDSGPQEFVFDWRSITRRRPIQEIALGAGEASSGAQGSASESPENAAQPQEAASEGSAQQSPESAAPKSQETAPGRRSIGVSGWDGPNFRMEFQVPHGHWTVSVAGIKGAGEPETLLEETDIRVGSSAVPIIIAVAVVCILVAAGVILVLTRKVFPRNGERHKTQAGQLVVQMLLQDGISWQEVCQPPEAARPLSQMIPRLPEQLRNLSVCLTGAGTVSLTTREAARIIMDDYNRIVDCPLDDSRKVRLIWKRAQ